MIVALFGFLLRPWGVIGLFTLTLGTWLFATIVEANISVAVGRWSGWLFVAGFFVWAIRRPSGSEAKLGFLRAIRFLLVLYMLVFGVRWLISLALAGFHFLAPAKPLAWGSFVIALACGLALYGFRRWLAVDEQRTS